ncbi:NAD(+)--dinitrogen-reductase ADP-D-ribosyltransferase [Paramagnetospirillum marisnigri]|uniref:NAD(+)--dinitrogen-reductase ADP-D-ribosyltransferase n=1 Tax=Paramagnetospirillum marisnigri TaxID=1285242 RepID=A0A178M8B8_9PROT|nr:NAD(+)--dinitrogen-reductase ADP-D-ribosyltransferase [Paramagnetospirillum marisnigri]OAN44776.1 NAD(+)--dinitrogen-reductase ADP-D-ribosyltransferase [Paramagnetospirillum marisnigri]
MTEKQLPRLGHSTNLMGLSTNFLGSTSFNDDPHDLHISGVREMNPTMFEMLEQSDSLEDAGDAFYKYMMAMFGIDPEQHEAEAEAKGKDGKRNVRRYRSSFLRLLKGWGYDSNGPEGAVLKGWVESRFGLFPTYHKEMITRFSTAGWMAYVEEKMSSRFHNNSIYCQLDMLYEFCQWALTRHVAVGKRHVTLYRGINSFDEHQIVERIDKKTVVMRLNNLASFSSDRTVADCFGDTILTVSVPLVKIVFFNTLLPIHPLKGEGEYLVVGGDYRVSASYF